MWEREWERERGKGRQRQTNRDRGWGQSKKKVTIKRLLCFDLFSTFLSILTWIKFSVFYCLPLFYYQESKNAFWADTRKQDLVVFRGVVRSPLYGLQICVFCLTLPRGLCYMSANSKRSGETALMRRLAWAFAGHLCDKCLFLMCWINKRQPGRVNWALTACEMYRCSSSCVYTQSHKDLWFSS